MNEEEHKSRHLVLHQHFDELMADFMRHTDKLLSSTTLMELASWSHAQTKNPTSDKHG